MINRRIFLVFSLLFMIILVGCSTNLLSNENPTVSTTNNEDSNSIILNMDTHNSMAFSTYIASGLLSTTSGKTNLSTNQVSDYSIVNLSDITTTIETEDPLQIETDLDEVNKYFDKLKVFMDNGVDSVLNVTEQSSTVEGFDYEITYSIEDVTYTIYYSIISKETDVDEVTTDTPEELSTTEVTTTENNIEDTDETNEDNETKEEDDDIEDTEEIAEDNETKEEDDDIEDTEEIAEDNEAKDENDEIEDTNEIDEDDNDKEYELIGLIVIDNVSYDLVGANELDGNETKLWFETVDSNNNDNYVRVEIKTEDGEQKFQLKTVIDGIESKSQIKFEQENDETIVKLELIQGENKSSYQFKKEIENNETTYKFQYQIGDIKGQVKIKEITDELGNVTYKYDIKENGKQKEIEIKKEAKKEKRNSLDNI